ncbi:MAG: PIN domain-containing protein [Chloroflexota bacterium]
MIRFLPDTSCIVAALCSWHEHHARAEQELTKRLERGETMIAAAPALVETYAVLTRLPPPHRLSAADALALLETNFAGETEVIALDAAAYWSLLQRASADGIAGGRVYDAVIAACAVQGKAGIILTFNERHFLPFRRPGLEVVAPGAQPP